jgi:isopentenyl-diphosphate delta-isomerase
LEQTTLLNTNTIVSFDDEPLILVDSQDHIIGYDTKDRVHSDQGLLHRAFSIFLITQDGHVLIQQRAAQKRLWPNYWSNSCCSHPRRGENYYQAAHRRLREELNIDTPLYFLYQFQYQAPYQDLGSEHELCSVYLGQLPHTFSININSNEIAAYQWLDYNQVDALIADLQIKTTPWFMMEWARIRQEFDLNTINDDPARHTNLSLLSISV